MSTLFIIIFFLFYTTTEKCKTREFTRPLPLSDFSTKKAGNVPIRKKQEEE